MSQSARRQATIYFIKAFYADMVGDSEEAELCIHCALTFTSPIGNLICQTVN